MESIIYINDKPFPYPKRGLNMIVSTIVDSARNANGEVVGQKIGRDNYKLDSLVWPFLDAKTWSDILKEFENFRVIARIPDMVHNKWITLQMYPGDRSAQPYWVDESGMPTHYIDCSVNIIDCGVME